MKILIVDDEEIVRNGLQKQLEYCFHNQLIETATAKDATEAVTIVSAWNPDIILTDIEMEEKNGFHLIREAHELGSMAEFIIVSGYSEFEYARNAIKLGVADYLIKPIDEDELVSCIQKIMDRRKNVGLESHTSSSTELQYSRMIKHIIEYINCNIGKPISIRDVANLTGKSENYISYVFKKETGINFNKYVTTQKMEYARKLAEEQSDIKVYELADAVGYSDVKYFSRLFKCYFGKSPGKLISE